MKAKPVTIDERAQREDWRPGLTLGLILGHFALFGVVAGVKGVIWAELIDALRIGEGPFGTAQIASSLISTIVVLLYARLVVRTGVHAIALAGLALMGIAILWLAWAGSFLALLLVLAVLGAGSGLLDGAMIQGSVDWERATRQARMNVIHSGFSVGAVVGAIAAGITLALGASYVSILIAVAIVCLLVLIATVPLRYPPGAPAGEIVAEQQGSDWRHVLSEAEVRALIAIILLSIVVESVAFIWAVIYLRDELGASAFVGGASFALFNGTMFIGRIVNTPLVARHGQRRSLLASGAGVGLGGLLLIASANVPLAIIALALIGLGVAGIFPTVMSAAAERLPDRSGALTTVVMTVAYLAFMLTPPAVGWIAELSSLRVAMTLVAISGVGILWLAWRLESATIRSPAETAQAKT